MYVTCPDCEYVYDGADDDRVAAHRDFHELRLVGLPVPASANARVITGSRVIGPDLRLVLAQAGGDAVLRQLAWDASILAAGMEQAKTMFDGGDHDVAAEAAAMVVVASVPSTSATGTYAVGTLIVRRRTHRVRVRWATDHIHDGQVDVDEEDPDALTCCQPVDAPTMLEDDCYSIDHVWVHRRHRRRGIARHLVDEAIRLYSMDVSAGLTWKHPFLTSAGATLAYQYNAGPFWLS